MTLTLRFALSLVSLAVALLAGATIDTARAETVTLTLAKTSKAVFSRPHDVILSPDKKYLLVADLGNGAVQVLDPINLEIVGVIGEGSLSAPHDVTFDAQGRLLVADSGNDRVVVYRFDGIGPNGKARATEVEVWSADMGVPEGIAVGAGERVFVANAYLDTVLALEHGRTIIKAGGGGKGPGQFGRPHDVHVDNQGRVLVVDSANNRIQILNRDLAPIGQIAGPPYNLYEPKYMTVDATGHVFISDQYNNRILILDSGYKIVGQYGGKRGSGAGELNRPEGVETDGNRVWVSDTYNDRILRLDRR